MERDRERFLQVNGNGGDYLHIGKVRSSSPTRSASSSPPSATVGVGVNGGGLNYILHTVSKYDTLAGVAIKYGVEVADIKRLNGLVTDLQMFALKTIQIPLPGRHPPSPIQSNGHSTPPRPSSSGRTASSRRQSDIFDSFSSLKLKSSSEKKASPAKISLQGYYGLRPADQKSVEMAVYQQGRSHYLEDGPFTFSSPISNTSLSHFRKSKSEANCLASETVDLVVPDSSQEAENSDTAKWNEKLVRRRQKSDADFTSHTPEKLLKEDNTSSIITSALTGKGLALRTKLANRSISGGVDGEAVGFNPIPIGLGDSFLTEVSDGVQKSSSASSLQDSDNGALSSIWSLKTDLQALSAAAITISIFDGLGKPSNRRNKAALD